MEAFTFRVLEVVNNIKKNHPKFNTFRKIADFLNKYHPTSETQISKWRKLNAYPTIQHTLLLTEHFKDYGATAEYLLQGLQRQTKS